MKVGISMQNNKGQAVLCCGCGEDTEYDQGRMVWESIDGEFGHKCCVEEYDKALKEKQVRKDQYLPPRCEKCERGLLLSHIKSEETGYRINELGEPIKPPIKLVHYSVNLEERLYCEGCNIYYKAARDEKGRLISLERNKDKWTLNEDEVGVVL